ncbi:uncharacterized protein TrAFT101_004852 [Trichoderma asperellum]|uniref:uncharacterized protein n=1 Tax=Trichoderma asperellum TaxID=101201 RepID=UPI00332769C2|nr:hypothetical protein TrAFT101_004852 [Trichoderma asperellum]
MASNANGNGSQHNDTSFTATQGCTQANISLIPEDLTFCIRRFLSDKDQRPPSKGCTRDGIPLVHEDAGFCMRRFLEEPMPVGMRPVRGEAEAEGNMSVLLHALDAKIGNSPVGHN